MRLGRGIGAGIAVSLLLAGGARAATTVVNPFAGNWNTTLSGGVTGTVKFSAIDATTGANQLQAMGGHPCGAPTTYYHGDYTDTAPDTGTMTACTSSAGHLVGRYENSNTALSYPGGDLDVTIDSGRTSFNGFFTADDPSFAGMTFPYSGAFAGDFTGDGCCTTTPPPPPPPPNGGGWVIGGGFDSSPWSSFCRVQRGFLPAGDPLATAASAQTDECTHKQLLSDEEKKVARELRKFFLLEVGSFCAAASEVLPGRANQVAELTLRWISRTHYLRDMCTTAVNLFALAAELANDPPDPAFWVLPGHATGRLRARAAASNCPTGMSAAQCAALNTAAANYVNTERVTATVSGYIATGANRTAAAVKANSPFSAFFQEAFAKVNEGALASDATALQSEGQRLGTLLHANHLVIRLSARDVQGLSRDLPRGLSSSQRNAYLRQLSSFSGTRLSALLGAAVPSATFAADYRSISPTDLAATVNGMVNNGELSLAVGKTLAADLTNALNVCQRVAAINQFIADAQAQAPSVAGFLKFGAQPLLAAGTPPSCNTTPPPTFTGSWNTTWFGAMQLTQTGNQVTGTYALCNGTATISGTVTGSTLDGTWTEPCDSGQGRIHVVLSADGNSFSGQWGEGTNTPSVSWTGTRTS